jgi:hypothetical protein
MLNATRNIPMTSAPIKNNGNKGLSWLTIEFFSGAADHLTDDLGGDIAVHPFGDAIPSRDGAVEVQTRDFVIRRFNEGRRMARDELGRPLRHGCVDAISLPKVVVTSAISRESWR